MNRDRITDYSRAAARGAGSFLAKGEKFKKRALPTKANFGSHAAI